MWLHWLLTSLQLVWQVREAHILFVFIWNLPSFYIKRTIFSFLLIPLHKIVHSGTAPLTAVQLLWVNMIMDTLGALALATEPPNDDLMKRAPVGRKGNFISNVMWRNILGQSLYQFVVICLLQSKGKGIFGLEGPDSDLILNTIIFNSFVFCQVTFSERSTTMICHKPCLISINWSMLMGNDVIFWILKPRVLLHFLW